VLRRPTRRPITFSFRQSPLVLGSSLAFCSVALLWRETCRLPGADQVVERRWAGLQPDLRP
jgi:hypothetical protein